MKTKTPTKPRKPTKKKTKAAIPAVTRDNGRVTINAEVIDDIFTEIIAKIMALQIVWEKISLKEELK
jgi:ribosomal protein S9